MEMNRFVFFPFFMTLPLILSALCYTKYREHNNLPFRNLAEFYLSLSVLLCAAWLLPGLGPAFIIISMFPWIWTLRTTGLICEDISGRSMFSKFHLYGLVLGGVISFIFLSFDLNLSLVTTPFALSIGLIGLSFIMQVYTRGKPLKFGNLVHLNLALMLVFYVCRLAFPLVISEKYEADVVLTVESCLVLLFSVIMYPLYAQRIFEKQVHMLERVVEARNRQLFGHSSFSEHRILSAGLSHEVNNALTIINAKITRLILGRSQDLNKDLMVIQEASNRITRTVRSLRDFIYPVEVWETVDLGDVMKDVLVIYGQRIANHNVRLKVEGFEGKRIYGLKIQLEQLFLSLINNSVDAIDKSSDKWISLTARTIGDEVEVVFQDSSPSRSAEIAPILNDPLHVHDEFMDSEVRLVLAKEITLKHDGEFHCGGGEYSTFVLTFPLTETARKTDNLSGFQELH